MYRIGMFAEGQIVTLETYESYSEADDNLEKYWELYPNAWIEVISDADLIVATHD